MSKDMSYLLSQPLILTLQRFIERDKTCLKGRKPGVEKKENANH